MSPVRVQRKRTRGWRMPENTVSVCRPGKWGNPFKVLQRECGCWDVEDENGVTYLLDSSRHGQGVCTGSITKRFAARDAIDLFRSLYVGGRVWQERDLDELATLAGKNLACFCPLDQPCHADVLLELANETR